MYINKKFNDAIVFADCASFYDVCLINIDNERIELNDYNGFVIGVIDYENVWDEIGIINRDSEGRLSDDTIIWFANGEPTSEWEEMIKEQKEV